VTAAARPRLGFLGVGWIGGRRLDAVREHGLGEVVAIADPAVPGALRGLDDLLELEIDGVVIATPSAQHAGQSLAAIEHGKAVFCQKPLALDEPQARRVVEAARASDRLLGVDFCYRRTEAAEAVRRLVASGELGEIFAAELCFHNAYGPDKAWFYDPSLSGGGCLVDLGIHLVDLALWVLGFPAVTAVEARLVGEPLEHYATAHLAVGRRTTIRLACSWNLHAGVPCVLEASFYGEHGGVSLRNVGGSFYDFRADRFSGTETEPLALPPDQWGGRTVIDWIAQLAAGERFDPTATRYVQVHDVLDRIYAAAR
jgi:predicted dehydrogenase